MITPQNRTMNSQPTPLTPYPPDAISPAPGITVPAPLSVLPGGACRLVPHGINTMTFFSPFVVSLSNHERSHFDRLNANGTGSEYVTVIMSQST